MKYFCWQTRCVYVFVFLVVALIMTIYETIKEFIFEGSLSPWESHTITIIVTACIAVLASTFIRAWSIRIQEREHRVRLREEKAASLHLILNAVRHIINNVLHHFMLIQLELENNGRLKDETIRLLDTSVEETKRQLKILEDIKEPENSASYVDIYPKGTNLS